jgi:hypothetical protein
MLSFVRLSAHALPRVYLCCYLLSQFEPVGDKISVLVVRDLVWKNCERDSGNQDVRYTHFSLYGRNPFRENRPSDENPLREMSGRACAGVLTHMLAGPTL